MGGRYLVLALDKVGTAMAVAIMVVCARVVQNAGIHVLGSQTIWF